MQKRCAYCRKALEEGKVVKMTILIIHGTYHVKECIARNVVANTTPWPTRPNVKPAEAGCTSGATDQSYTGNYQNQ